MDKELTILKKAIIEKIHGLPWEDAKWEEMRVEGCEILSDNHVYIVDGDNFIVGCKECLGFECGSGIELSTPGKSLDKFTVLGLPITLSRVLQALEKTDMYGSVFELNACETSWWLKFKQYSRKETVSRFQFDTPWVEWKLLKEDKSTATLEDQSEETIKALTKIFL